MINVPAYDRVDGRPDFDTVYTRCPRCGVVATGGATYQPAPDGDIDPSRDLELTCQLAGHRYTAPVAAILPRDATSTCRRPGCGHTYPVPAGADEVVCPACRLHQDGPARTTNPGRREHHRQIYGAYMDGVRAQLRTLRDRDPGRGARLFSDPDR